MTFLALDILKSGVTLSLVFAGDPVSARLYLPGGRYHPAARQVAVDTEVAGRLRPGTRKLFCLMAIC